MDNSNKMNWGLPLCRHSVIVHRWENPNLISDAPALVKLPDGTLLCSVELWSRDAYSGEDVLAEKRYGRDRCLIFASSDNGVVLHYSRDAQNWFSAGVLAMASKETQAFNYCTPLVDGDDLLFVSRTAKDAENQHDNDQITFHRVQNFRQTAVNLVPAPEVRRNE